MGPSTLKQLEKLGIQSIEDLLFHLPYRYEDRTRIVPIGALENGQQALIEGWVQEIMILPKGRRSLLIKLGDGTGGMSLRFFYYTHDQFKRIQKGQWIRCFGEARMSAFGTEMTHPTYQLIQEYETGQPDDTLTPVYPLTEGLNQKLLRRLVQQALQQLRHAPVEDLLPATSKRGNLRLIDALESLHSPPSGLQEDSPLLLEAKKRLAFEELVAHHLSLSRHRHETQSHQAPILNINPAQEETFLNHIGFELTRAQQRVIREILKDLDHPYPMMRLVQGDVGSGKTVVAALAALAALSSGFQVALMAPTELLAEQHAKNFSQWLGAIDERVVFLAGKSRSQERKQSLEAIQSGSVGMIIGTHALFQDAVEFHQLGLIIIDEQHRFGVHQRLNLLEKGKKAGLYPHQLVMTATPIPRTLAMLGYADLELSVIDERPPGRTPVKTTVLSSDKRETVIERIADWVHRGRQVYWVCTLIEESEVLQAEAAEQSTERLKALLGGLRIDLIHGRLKPDEKEAIMQAFKQGLIDVLVATTVIEVGVDVPNASLMVIENSERLGLSQLHQLRGRVGRGPGESHCVLLYQSPLSQNARERLAILRESDDGFLIAEKDLALRGPGEFLGTRQTGQAGFRVADLARDGHLIDEVHAVAEEISKTKKALIPQLIHRWLGASIQYIGA